MDENRYRVWCKNKKEYEKGACLLMTNGDLYELHKCGIKELDLRNHIIELSTGVKDKKGMLIYRGDIVRNCESVLFTVCFGGFFNHTNKLRHGWYLQTIKEPAHSENFMNACEGYSNYEVVGNVNEGITDE